MAKTEVTKTGETVPAAAPGGVYDVFEVMRNEMNRMFDRFDRGWTGLPSMMRSAAGYPMSFGLDVREDDKAIMIDAELPGVEEKDVKLTIANGVLSITGEKKTEREETKDNYHLAERSFGSFSRSLRLPDTIDESKVEARFDKGVLKITAPKKPEAKKVERKIEISKG